MSERYEEIVVGESYWRQPPGRRHELVCSRLYAAVAECVRESKVTRLLPMRSVVEFGPGTLLRPDLTLITIATRKPWLVAEVIDPADHTVDTVVKKSAYEAVGMPRVWMIDPRYDNVEIYHSTPYGLALKRNLALKDVLTDPLLPGLRLGLDVLFGPQR